MDTRARREQLRPTETPVATETVDDSEPPEVSGEHRMGDETCCRTTRRGQRCRHCKKLVHYFHNAGQPFKQCENGHYA